MPIATRSSKFDISKESATASIAKKISIEANKGDVLFFLEKLVLVKLPLLDISLIICKKKID